jgi:hypothetical protein
MPTADRRVGQECRPFRCRNLRQGRVADFRSARIHEINVRVDAVDVCLARGGLIALPERRFSFDELELGVSHDREFDPFIKQIPPLRARRRRAGACPRAPNIPRAFPRD